IFSDEINYRVADFIKQTKKVRKIISNNNEVKKIVEKIKSSESGIIFLGWGNYDNSFYEELIKFSQNSNFPIFTDGTSDLRFTSSDHKNIIVNHSAILQSLRLSPDLILQFGNAPTSKIALEFLNKTKADKFVLNKFGDLKDSSKRKAKVVNVEPSEFLKIAKLNDLNSTKRKSFI
ncbi:MAG: hypothetical protein KDC88_17980, partial [Ignavibacteriae bacterium]|nr:hypothetical protein [Ignavibacteriota bacterium]